MQIASREQLIKVFGFYKNSIFRISTDLSFWKLLMDNQAKLYENKNDFPSAYVFEAGFAVMNLHYKNPEGRLKMHTETFKVTPAELINYRIEFYEWMMNISLVKAYNTCEIFLLRSIQLMYFEELTDPMKNRRAQTVLVNEIKKITPDSKRDNNKFIIDFLKIKCPKFLFFANRILSEDIKGSWEDFFEMISILRNIVAHNNSIIDDSTFNNLKSKNIFLINEYFSIKLENDGFKTIVFRTDAHFSAFINLINDFSLNTVKLIFDKNDFKFLGMI